MTVLFFLDLWEKSQIPKPQHKSVKQHQALIKQTLIKCEILRRELISKHKCTSEDHAFFFFFLFFTTLQNEKCDQFKEV